VRSQDRLTGNLWELEPGESARVVAVDLPVETALKLAEMGLAVHRKVRMIRRAPAGDPLEIELIHYRLAIRASEARGIRIRRLTRKGN
jgi:ferrous iron transport protein A